MEAQVAGMRRLQGLSHHVGATAARTVPELLLSDAQVRQFAADGFLALPVTGLPSELHASIYERATNPDALDFQRPDLLRFGREGDRIYPLIPELSDVIGSPSVSGALTSLLGRGWRLGCHRTLHGGGGAQGIHKDTQRDKAVLPPMRFCFVFYYPAGAAEEMGPTAVFPGSHLLGVDDQDWGKVTEDPSILGGNIQEVPAVIPHGQPGIVIGHGSLLHRATERLPEADARGLSQRPMFKLWFGRTEDPACAPPVPGSGVDECPPFETLTREPALVPAIESMWEWLRPQHRDTGSERRLTASELERCTSLLTSLPVHGDEPRRVGAAYRLGRAAAGGQTAATQILLTSMINSDASQAARRSAVHGLQVAGSDAVPVLVQLLQGPATALEVVTGAADAIGECATAPEHMGAAVAALRTAMEHMDGLIDSAADRGWPARQMASSAEGGRYSAAPEVGLVSCLVAMASLAIRAVSRSDATMCSTILHALMPWLAAGGRACPTSDEDEPGSWPPTEHRSITAAVTWNLVCLSRRPGARVEPALARAMRAQETAVSEWTSSREGGTSAPFNIMQLVGNPPFTERPDFLPGPGE